jgi:tagatose-1,6-bisphosphate aldolase
MSPQLVTRNLQPATCNLQTFNPKEFPMKTLSIGKIRGLQQCSTARGTITTLALDHRQNLRKSLNPQSPETVSDIELTGFKVQVAAALGHAATSVLIDPEFGAAQAVAAGAIPASAGLVVAVEASGYTGDPAARHSRVLPGWSVEKVRRMGASMAKILVYYHPDSPTANEGEAFVRQVADDCRANDIPLMLEPLSYPLDPNQKSLSSHEKRYVVVETARRLTPLGADVLKAEFPLGSNAPESEWAAACHELNAASPIPWILLSAAVDFETYLRQVTTACQQGASGIAVGRAVWKEATNLHGEGRTAFLRDVAYARLERLTNLCQALARPWTEFFAAPEVTTEWYAKY